MLIEIIDHIAVLILSMIRESYEKSKVEPINKEGFIEELRKFLKLPPRSDSSSSTRDHISRENSALYGLNNLRSRFAYNEDFWTPPQDEADLLRRLNTQHQKPLFEDSTAVRQTNSLLRSSKTNLSPFWEKHEREPHQILTWVRKNIIGFNTVYTSSMRLQLETVYIDHTATNRPFKIIESMVDYCKLFAANPHTQFSEFGKYSTQMMHYARDSLLQSFSASPTEYVVLPAGNGATGAIQKAIRNLKGYEDKGFANPTIYLTPYEHHSNILPWIEYFGDVKILAHNQKYGTLHIEEIYGQILKDPNPNIIISVSGASNVTSKTTPLSEVNAVVKQLRKDKNRKFVFGVDCAAYCCHHELNVEAYDQIDFAYISPHKNLGGAESCGVLLARRSLVSGEKPTFPGGGTVRFVKGYTKDDIYYEEDPFAREIVGTPSFIGFYRAALSFELLKNAISYEFIHKRQKQNTKLFFEMIQKINKELSSQNKGTQIHIYGEKNLKIRANVVTLNFQREGLQFIHYNLVSLLLSDVFGIQVRSGCFCAGPFGIEMLQFSADYLDQIKKQIEGGVLIHKPGFIRLDLTFYLQSFEVEYIANALALIAHHHEKYQKLYKINLDGNVIPFSKIIRTSGTKFYRLQKYPITDKIVEYQDADHLERLKNRKNTLKKQLTRGEQIAHNIDKMIDQLRAGKKPSF